MIVETTSPIFGTVRAPASRIRFGTQPIVHSCAPARGEHTRQVCADLLGYDATTIDELNTASAFGFPARQTAAENPGGRMINDHNRRRERLARADRGGVAVRRGAALRAAA